MKTPWQRFSSSILLAVWLCFPHPAAWSQNAPVPAPSEQDPGTEPAPPPPKPPVTLGGPKVDPQTAAMIREATTVDLSKRRIVGREKLELAPDLTVHADHIKKEANGTLTLTGRIYVDGGAFKSVGLFSGFRMYGNKLVWNPAKKLATLTELVFLETATDNLYIRHYGTAVDSSMTIDLQQGGKIGVVSCSASATSIQQ